MKTVALLCDSLQDSPNESWLTINAALQLARICRSRKCKLILYANSSVAIPVLLASSEYHQPAALESDKPYSQETVFIRPYDLFDSNIRSAETMFLSFSIDTINNEDGLVNALLYLVQSESDEGRYRSGLGWNSNMKIQDALINSRPSIVIKLGSSTRLSDAIQTVGSLAKGQSLRYYTDVTQDDDLLSLPIESVFGDKHQKFSWPDYFRQSEKDNRKQEFSEKELEEISIAERLARYSLAFEMIVDQG
jgi:hypothetical protein